MPGQTDTPDAHGGAFGPNAWLVDDMYEQYRSDPSSVSQSWQDFFADYVPPREAVPTRRATLSNGAAAVDERAEPAAGTTNGAGPSSLAPPAPLAPDSAVSGPAAPAPRPAPTASEAAPAPQDSPGAQAEPSPTPLRGAAGRIAANMEASLSVPTATSVRTIPARLLEVNRAMINQPLARETGAKVSFTHIIGFAVAQGLRAVTALNSSFVSDSDGKGTPGVIHHQHIGLGLAVDVAKSDGSRTLLVPVIRQAEEKDFRAFVLAYEEMVRKVHTAKATPDDFAGATVTLTNPGTLGTVQSVPRLMPGQGAIIGVGALGYPAEYQAADPRSLAALGVGPVVTITSTYDHRIIQGAESGLFLTYVAECLTGGH